MESSVESSSDRSGETSKKILESMRKNSFITISELAEELGKTTRAIEKQIAKLQANGQLKRIGPTKRGHWEVFDKGD
ncbi:MAG: winged helix-turn-helix transcriptional regulator [Candidatus Aminicenantes bacterium]|nr:winged helix-turn-helix transcriptional regulator [Candidatus Aminicenantes bacterium]